MNRFKVVYVLVSDNNDYYYEELLISLISLNKHNPNLEVIIITDNITNKNLIDFRAEIKKYASNIIVKSFDDSVSKRVRSRLLKVSVRELVEGDFLFIDCDTLIADKLDEICKVNVNLAMVLDGHTLYSKKQDKTILEKGMDLVGFGKENILNEYFNSGVIYCRDTKESHEFYKKWKENYQICLENNLFQDQLSLNFTNYEYKLIHALDGKWNCQMDRGVKYLNNAIILHYLGFQYGALNKVGNLNFLMHEISDEKIFSSLKNSQIISEKLDSIIKNPRNAIKNCITVPTDSIVYKLIHSNCFLMLDFLYIKCRPLFNFFENIFKFIYKIYVSIKRFLFKVKNK